MHECTSEARGWADEATAPVSCTLTLPHSSILQVIQFSIPPFVHSSIHPTGRSSTPPFFHSSTRHLPS